MYTVHNRRYENHQTSANNPSQMKFVASPENTLRRIMSRLTVAFGLGLDDFSHGSRRVATVRYWGKYHLPRSLPTYCVVRVFVNGKTTVPTDLELCYAVVCVPPAQRPATSFVSIFSHISMLLPVLTDIKVGITCAQPYFLASLLMFVSCGLKVPMILV